MLDPGDLTFRLNSPGSSEEEYAIIQELLEHKEWNPDLQTLVLLI